MSITIFACGGRRKRKPCATGCSAPAYYACEYAFTGKAAGRMCARPCCAFCVTTQPDGRHFCKIHHDVARGAVK